MSTKNEQHPPFNQTQIDIIENELANRNFTVSSQDIEICELAQLLQQKYFNSKSSLDVAVFLRTRISNMQRLQPQIPQAPSISLDARSSMFRQFAEIKQENSSLKQYICKSKRKVRPTEPVKRKTLDQTVQSLDSSISECHAIFERKGRKGVINQAGFSIHQSCLWAFHEQFYSSLDKYYLHDDELFSRLVAELGMAAERMTYSEHRMLRRALPAPRLFGPQFLSNQFERLGDIRAQLRSSPRQKGKEFQLNVGKEVIAVHPVCGHLHSACILAIYKENQFMVKFQRPQLGTQKVLDILMAPKQISSPHRVVIQNVDFEVMALAIRLLQYKADLLKLMKQYNINAEAIQRSQGSLDNVFFQEYGWIGSTINILSLGIKHVVSKFRIRGLSSSNQQKIGKHFSSILINPLTLMQKQLDKSSENSDMFAAKQIKNIMNTHKQSRSEHYVKELFNKCINGLKNCSLQTDQREQMERIMRSMIGLLVNLRYESRSFSIQDNRYLNELMALIDGRYPQHVNQIYETLHSITSKIGGEVK